MNTSAQNSPHQRLEDDLCRWIKQGAQSFIVESLSSPDLPFVDFEDILRCCVKHNNMDAFGVLMNYSENNCTDVQNNHYLQSAVWDSVVHNVVDLWKQYFNWSPHNRSLNNWRERLYIHTAKHNRLQMLKHLQNHTQVSFDTWRDAVISCVERGYPDIYAHLLQHPVELTAQSAAGDLGLMVAETYNNQEELFHVAFEYATVGEILSSAPAHKHQSIQTYYQTYQHMKASEQKQTLLDHISSPSLTSKRKI